MVDDASFMGPEPGRSVGGEPEGFDDAVQAAALMLGIMTVLAWIGFQWQRGHEQAAYRFAVDLVERISRRGDLALTPVWSGLGRGPGSVQAHETFRALHNLGRLEPAGTGQCRVSSQFGLCPGTRYSCHVSAATPAGPVKASIGLCSTGAHVPYTFDTFDLTLPAVGDDRGNRAEVDIGRDGLIRYGTTPLPPETLPVRLHRRIVPPLL